MTTEKEPSAVIDELLSADDSELLLKVAQYRQSIIDIFGRQSLLEILCDSIEKAENVEFFSRRSRREINPARMEVSIRVNHTKAIETNLEIKSRWEGKYRLGLEEKDILTIKSDIIHTEVCREVSSYIVSRLQPHWENAKKTARIKYDIKDERLLQLFTSTIFSVRVIEDNNVRPEDRMCILLFFI